VLTDKEYNLDKMPLILNNGLPSREEQPSPLLPIVQTVPTDNPYLTAATSENTRRAYQADIRHFEKWGGKLPASKETVLHYLQAFAAQLNSRTLARRLTALKNWHIYQGFSDPTQHPAIGKTLTGIMRTHGKPKEKAPPLLPEHLLQMVTHLNSEQTLRAYRDNALLQLAFFGAFRRSEIIAICCEHIVWQEQGIDILIPHSKTDQTNQGLYCAIPYGKQLLCPVQALKHWLEQANITKGPIFRRLYRDDSLAQTALTALSVSHILKRRAQQAKIPQAEQFSSHSLRRGLATAASRDGSSLPAIMRQGRWKHVNTVMEYIDAVQRFEENAAANVLENISN
ncbi:MAG TPA: site-specific integrase, partial [Gammaproteobacteria bacterium]|jgi:integrase|nr:site-specific integrase [Gammaproteobacteria bacterium]